MADLVTSRIFVDGEKGITAAKLNDIVASSVIQPAFYTSKPTAGTADPTDIALILKSGAYAQVPISTLGGSATQAQIWSTRLRSFNAIGNPNFEVDQRNAGGAVVLANNWACDRWQALKSGAMTLNGGQLAGLTNVPGTSFIISGRSYNINLTAQDATLGAGDYLEIIQTVEGSVFRELINDVHSFSIYAQSSVANLKFSVALRDGVNNKTLCKLCTLGAASTPTLIQLPNLPSFGAGMNVTSGSIGYTIRIGLAAGVTYMPPSNDTWITGDFVGALGMDNWASKPLNSTFTLFFVQHEPGAVCSTFMDKPFSQNLDECLRYFQKTYNYGVLPGTVSSGGAINLTTEASRAPNSYLAFQKRFAKVPNIVVYSPATGAINSVRDSSASLDRAAASTQGLGEAAYNGLILSNYNAAATQYTWHHTADTGW